MSTTAEVPVEHDVPAPPAPPAPSGWGPQLAPHAAVGALVVAAGAARIAVYLAGDEAQVAQWVAASAFVLAVVAAARIRGKVFDKRAKRRAHAFLAVAAGWLTTVTMTGLSLGAVGILMAFGYGLSMYWWRRHPLGLIQPPAVRAGYQRLWAENIGCGDGALPGSRLSSPQQIPAGVRYTLRLKPGKQTRAMALGALDKLRGGLKLRTDQELLIEAHLDEPEPTQLLTIVTKSPVKQTVLWPGPEAFDPVTGEVRLGPFVDGEGTATWQVYTETRLLGGYLQGGTNGGKSRTMEMLALTIAAAKSHPTVILYADGQGGASSPLMMEHADVKARTPEQALAMLEGMYLVMQLRQDENAVWGLRGFTARDDRPGLIGFLDECHKLLDKMNNPALWARTQFLVAAITSEGGKVGVALVLASQQSTLDAFGGAGSPYAEKIRANLLTGNGAMFKGKDSNAKSVFKVEVDPRTFPDMPGYAFLVNPRPGARSAPFRSCYLTDEMAEKWPKRIKWRSLDSGAAAAWGETYLRRAELAEEALEEAKRRIAARRAGIVLDAPSVPAQRQSAEQAPPEEDEDALATFGGTGFPSWSEMEAQARQEAQRQLHDGHDKVLQAIHAGSTSPKALVEATGYSERQVHNLLTDLLVAGRIRKPRTGRYEVAQAA